MLNHATMKVMEAEKQKTESDAEHSKKAAKFRKTEEEVQKWEKKLTKVIQRSRPYFEQKDAFNKALEAQKKMVQDLQGKVARSKATYSDSLRNLESISESIHARRRLKRRSPGVGAELASVPSFDLDSCDFSSTQGEDEDEDDLYSGRSSASGATFNEDMLSNKMTDTTLNEEDEREDETVQDLECLQAAKVDI